MEHYLGDIGILISMGLIILYMTWDKLFPDD